MPGFNIYGSPNSLSINNRNEFHRSHRWFITNLGLPSGLRRSEDENFLRLYAKSLDLPAVSFEEQDIPGGTISYKIPKKVTWDNVTVEFYDVYGLYELLDKWLKSIWTPEDGFKLAADYMGVPEFIQTNGNGDIIRSFSLFNAYPIKINHSQLTYTSNDIKSVSVTYSYTHISTTFESSNSGTRV